MPRASKRKPLFTFKHTVNFEVYPPEFEPLESVKFLDYRLYEKGTHKVEIGFVLGGCCRKLVRAIVTKGMVTGFEVEPCSESKPISASRMAILKEVRKRLSAKMGKWRPIPLSDLAITPDFDIWGKVGCFTICEGGADCWVCCFGLFGFHCIDIDEIIR